VAIAKANIAIMNNT